MSVGGLTHQEFERLRRPLYSFAEADRLADVTRGTSGRWLKGYSWDHEVWGKLWEQPVTPGARSQEETAVSFLDLIEVVAIGKLREQGDSLPRIRRFVRYCHKALKKPRPLVTETFKTDSREIFLEEEGHLLDVGRQKGQQVWNEVLAPF